MVLGLNHYESENTVRQFGQQNGVTFPLLLDGSSYSAYAQPGQSPFPLDYLVDREGNVAYFNTEYDPITMLAIVDSLINPPTSTEDEIGSNLPDRFILLGNYPNPFNSSTNIKFFVPSVGYAEVTIYDILGRRVENIFGGDVQTGEVVVNWSVSTNESNELNSGIYFYKVIFARSSLSGKILYLK